MSKRAKYRQRRILWLKSCACGELPYQTAERELDANHLTSLRERGLIDEPLPKKPVEHRGRGRALSSGDAPVSDRCSSDAARTMGSVSTILA